MNIERSRVGEPALRTGFKLFGSVNSEKRKTPACVHEWRPPSPPDCVETFEHPAATNTAAAIVTTANGLFKLRLQSDSVRLAWNWGRCRCARKTRDKRSARSPTA